MSASIHRLPGQVSIARNASVSRCYFGSDAEKAMLEIARIEQAAGAMVSIVQNYEAGHGHFTEITILRIDRGDEELQ